MTRELLVKTPASCGEIVEGRDDQGSFLLSYAINCYSRIQITPGPWRPLPPKSQAMVHRLQALWNLPDLDQLMIQIDSDIPLGMGMSSSTADLAGLVVGLAMWYQIPISDQEVFDLCVKEEPSDGVMFSQPSLVNFMEGGPVAYRLADFDYDVLCLFADRRVETCQHYQDPRLEAIRHRQRRDYSRMRDQLFCVQSQSDLADLAFQSACLNQAIHALPGLEQLNQLRQTLGIAGFNIAHSGSVIAIWFRADQIRSQEILSLLRSIKLAYHDYQVYRTVDGGSEVTWVGSH